MRPVHAVAWIVLGFILPVQAAETAISRVARPPRSLSFSERVAAQEAIERVYYRHQSGATRPFEEAVPRSAVEAKVRKSLEQTAALQTYWHTAVTDASLQRELERMAAGSRMSDRLQELFAALGNDTFLIKECLARPILVERLSHNFYASDTSIHADARHQAEALRERLVNGELSPKADEPHRSLIEIGVTDASTVETSLPGGPTLDRDAFAAARAKLPSQPGVVSETSETAESFTFSVVLGETPGASVRVASYVIRKTPWETWWQSVRAGLRADGVPAVATDRVRLPAMGKGAGFDPNAPCTGDGWHNGILDGVPEGLIFHTAVWTGNEVIVWGGSFFGGFPGMGGRYDPITDTWRAVSTDGAPLGRLRHTAVWSGTEMIVWGGGLTFGVVYDTGGRYDPVSDTWRKTSLIGVPQARDRHTAIWTGSRMVVWGGDGYETGRWIPLATGGIYDPSADTWTPTSRTDAPSPRDGHSAVWTGSEMIIYGGGAAAPQPTGARFNPATNTWTPIALGGGRWGHTAVWTGTEMVAWGGIAFAPCSFCYPPGYGFIPVNTGERYDPVRDRWLPTTTDGAPLANYDDAFNAVWTGHRMLVWGGDSSANRGGNYDPATDHWTPINAAGAPVPRALSATVWTGSLMVIWGGQIHSPVSPTTNTGGRYDPWTDSWTPTSFNGAPSPRSDFSTVWTGNRMIVWGGASHDTFDASFDTGAGYDPATDSWSPTSTEAAAAPRGNHLAVWTGHEMIVWGGQAHWYESSSTLDSGGRYDPLLDTWSPMTVTDAPLARTHASAVWTGHEFLVWGAVSTTAGGGARYDPLLDLWTPIADTNAPAARLGQTTVWTGTRMIVWGGQSLDPSQGNLDTGGAYDPAADAWTPTPTSGAPSPRANHSAVWTGSEMIVWGGAGNGSSFPINTGARYDPAADRWTPTSTAGVLGHLGHQAVWTGGQMIIWGGSIGSGLPRSANTGTLYDPTTDHWTKITKHGEPINAGVALWSGDAMLLWSGSRGGRYFPGSSLDLDCDGDGVTSLAGDCDDHDPATLPGAPAVCDGKNNDCANVLWPTPPSGESDFDGDGFLGCQGDCDDSSDHVYPGAPQICDGLNNNCDPSWDYTTEADQDRDGYRVCDGDCDDTRAYVHPGAYDGCNGLDDNCDGTVDENGDAACGQPRTCWSVSCQGINGCQVTVLDGSPCSDGDPCTVNDTCHYDYCSGDAAANGTPCDDGNMCTMNDICRGSTYRYCVGDVAPGAPCDDGNVCTTGDACDQNGDCYGPDRVQCDDGNACDGAEYCEFYHHTGCVTIPLDCDDGNVCTSDLCDPQTGCYHVFNTDPCDDGDACTVGDQCGDGLCQPGVPVTCDDGNSCTADSCHPAYGCLHTNVDGACDDGNLCTQGDACVAGACVGSSSVACPPGDACHEAGVCDPVTGLCSGGAKPDGTVCSDGDLCTTGDRCIAGACTPQHSGLIEPMPQTNGYYKSLCHGAGFGDALTDADALCVAGITRSFAAIGSVAELCEELTPSHPNSDSCDRTDDDLMTLALNVCRGRVCTAQGIDSQCGGGTVVGESLAEADAILAAASRNADTCARAKCLTEEINTGRALELDSLSLRRDAGGVRLDWRPPYLDNGGGHPGHYNIWRRVAGSKAPFVKVGVTTAPTYLDPMTSGSFEYDVTAVMN